MQLEALSVGFVAGLLLISYFVKPETEDEDAKFYRECYEKSKLKTVYSKNILIKDHLSSKYK